MSDTKTVTGHTLSLRRTFKGPRERVFAAFTDAALIRRWMGPPGTEIPEAQFDAREGGTYRIAMRSATYGDMVVKGVITALRAPEHLAYTWTWEEDDPAEERETLVRIDFIDRGNETEMHLVHEGLASEESRANHENGWNGAFDKVDAVL